MSDLDELDLLREVMATNAPQWSDTERNALVALAQSYLDRATPRADLARSVKAVRQDVGASASWSVFATWLVRRAGRFGIECRDS